MTPPLIGVDRRHSIACVDPDPLVYPDFTFALVSVITSDFSWAGNDALPLLPECFVNRSPSPMLMV